MARSSALSRNWPKLLRSGKRLILLLLYTKSSRSIEAARRRAPKRTFLDKLKYSEIDGDLKITFQSRWYIIRRAPLLEKVQYIYITIFKARL